jgi:hypothetical protein
MQYRCPLACRQPSREEETASTIISSFRDITKTDDELVHGLAHQNVAPV